ncbi:MAG: hypothetical protein LBB53_03960 [Prevotellaceae bacterium]|jgi:tetratricopeptide (TPR) repeat protein|nr:hypothetical protein [Prevotellaceae bacterium]
MNFIFKIFGAPHIFDLYQGSENEINYFQSFDAGSENVKLTVHRMTGGQVSYSYLRYNILSSSGRTGAFFGMSVVFRNGEYCADMESLYNLFDTVYKTILQNRILLEEVKGSSEVQAKFLVQKFSDAESEVKRVEGIVCNNLQTNYANDILLIDNAFKNATSGLKRLNINAGNTIFISALRQSMWVSISPEYKEDEVDTLSPDDIFELKKSVKETRVELTEISNALLKGEPIPPYLNINKLSETLNNSNKTIHKYLKVQLKELEKIRVETDSVIEQYHSVATGIRNRNSGGGTKNVFTLSANFTDGGGTTIGSGSYEKGASVTVRATPNRGYRFINWTKNGQTVSETAVFQYQMPAEDVTLTANFEKKAGISLPAIPKKAIVWSGGGIAAIILVVFLVKGIGGKSSDKSNCPECQAWLNTADSIVTYGQFQDFDKAISLYKKAEQKGAPVNDKIAEVNAAAVDTLKARAETEFKKTETQRLPKIDCYNAAVNQLRTAVKYGYQNVEGDIAGYKKQTIDYYFDQIPDKKPAQIVKFCDIILGLDPTNADALAKKQAANTLATTPARPATTPVHSPTPTVKKEDKKGDCYTTYDGKTKKASDWLSTLQTDLNEAYDYVIGACEVIINNCSENKLAAQELQKKAREAKATATGKAVVNKEFNN